MTNGITSHMLQTASILYAPGLQVLFMILNQSVECQRIWNIDNPEMSGSIPAEEVGEIF